MADQHNFKSKFTSDESDLIRGTKRAVKSIQNLQKANEVLARQYIEGKRTIDSYTDAVNRNNKRISSLQGSLRNAAGATGKFGKANAQAVPAMQEFSRIIQDAPYGIQGVANNVQQLTAQFQYLSAKSGGAIAALKAMGSALAGPAGILLAVSAITAAMPYLIDKFGDGKSELEKFTEAVEDFNKATSLTKSRLDTLRSIQKLREAQGLSNREQIKEEIALTKSLMSRAAAMVEMLNTQIMMTKAAAVQSGFLEKAAAAFLVAMGRGGQIGGVFVDEEMLRQLGDLEIQAEKSRKEIVDLNIALLELINRTKESGSAGREGAIGVREYASAITALGASLKDAYTYWDQFRDGASGRSTGDDIAGGDWVTIFAPDALIAAGQRLKEAAGTVANDLADVNGQVFNMGNALAASFANFGTGIADAITNGSLSITNAGNILLSSLGDFLVSLGQAMIAYGTAKLALDSLGLTGAAAIAAGTLAVVAGKALSQHASNGLREAVSGGTSGRVGGAGSTSFSGTTASTATGFAGSGRVVFEISGNKLLGVLENAKSQNRAYAGPALT